MSSGGSPEFAKGAEDPVKAPVKAPMQASWTAPPAHVTAQLGPLLGPLLATMSETAASDLHLTEGEFPRLRVDGLLHPPASTTHIVAPLPIPAGMLRAKLEGLVPTGRGVDFMIPSEQGDRFRGHAFREGGRWALTLRRIPNIPPELHTLGLPQIVQRLAERPRGLVLVTGATGSGKSTTLAAMVDHLNRTFPVHIVTIEDPVEFLHPSRRALVHQREVGRDVASFDVALSEALRQDPDVLLVGELRSPETIRAALTLAETGHLVLGTLHTATAPEAISRIVDGSRADDRSEVRTQLAQVLEGVIAQRLVRRISHPGTPPEHPVGRLAVAEVLVATPAARSMIRDGRIHQLPSLLQSGRAHGMQTFTDAFVQRVVRGEVHRDEAIRAAPDPEDLERALQGHRP
jgi:twitching motility protein PilT